jgi:hypothetical protein
MITKKPYLKLSALIGANNETGGQFYGQVEKDKVEKAILSFGFEGYTLIDTVGFWDGGTEKSVNLIIYAEVSDKKPKFHLEKCFHEMMNFLCSSVILNQYSILYEVTEVELFEATKQVV